MHLTLIKSIFSKIKNIGIIYSNYTKDIIVDFKNSAKALNINIIPYKIRKNNLKDESFTDLLTKVDSVIIIPDPILLKKQTLVKRLFHNARKENVALFAYHKLFLKYGAILSISIDNPTTGRQIANMIQDRKNQNNKNNTIQYPAGTKVIFNRKAALKQNIFFEKDILPLINEVIE